MNRLVQNFKRAAAFGIDQIQKTVRRPTRIVIIPYGFLADFISSYGLPLAAGLITRAAPRLTARRFRPLLALAHFNKGSRLLARNQPDAAWQSFQACLEISTDPSHFFVAAVCLLVGLGRYRDAMALFGRANDLRKAQAKTLGIEKSRIRFLETIWTGAFGHLAQIQYLIKLNILEGRQPDETIVYVPRAANVPNRFLLDQWRPYLTIIENEKDLPLPLDTLRSLSFDFLAPRLADGSTVYYWEVAARVLRQWRSENRAPLLHFPSDLEERGLSALASCGVPRNSWFATVHVREPAYKKHHAELHNVLNGQIADYVPAIREITDRGGWVVRLGDPQMTKLPAMPNVFDYCHSSIRSDWMDIFLLARCRLFLGTSSGPAYVPAIYGVPMVLTNWWPPAQLPWDENAIFIPKLYRKADGSTLPLSAALAEPFGYCNSIDHLKESEGLTVEDNAPRDIRDAVVEMIERLEGAANYSPEDIDMRQRASRIFQAGGAHGMGLIARDFLRRSRNILD